MTGHDFHGHDATVALLLADGTRVTARVPGHAVPVSAGEVVGVRVEGPCRVWRAQLDR